MDIQEFKNEIIKSEAKVSELLRKAKILASELGDKEFLKWIDREMNGYSSGKPPSYRLIRGEPKALNPVLGRWIPVMFPKDDKTQDLLSRQHIFESIPELENLLDKSEDYLQIKYPPPMQEMLAQAVKMRTEFAMFFPQSQIVSVLEAVRDKLLDWTISKTKDKPTIRSSRTEKDLFPNSLVKKLPPDLKILCDDFNFNFANKRPIASILILRRILPLSIVRKFQQINKESEVKDEKGQYLETKNLLGKAERLLSNKRIYKEVMNYKILIDSAQHSYSINIQLSDVEGAAVKIRIFLEELFK
ncbi:hypothetical protein J7K05_00795 [bacterium]|nr:hypothetical protein [bacterium]